MHVNKVAGVTDVLTTQAFERLVMLSEPDAHANVRDFHRLGGGRRAFLHVCDYLRSENFLKAVKFIEMFAEVGAAGLDAKYFFDRLDGQSPHNGQFGTQPANVYWQIGIDDGLAVGMRHRAAARPE